jgi:hypothetical protein
MQLLTNLANAVQRAGPVFTGQCTNAPAGEGFRMTLQLAPGAITATPVGATLKQALVRLMRGYVTAGGWRTRGVSVKKGYVELFVAPSSASSSTSKRP